MIFKYILLKNWVKAKLFFLKLFFCLTVPAFVVFGVPQNRTLEPRKRNSLAIV